ncbi:MAG TPA: Zn-ribbon domain-containing OB-fold protein [Burkholderiaceae bacterium]|nr:Zn-ribbon domain-containing OB-fold protein [Burkholderiaceae bacterium]
MSARLAEVAMAGPRPLAPRVSAFTRPFWDALAEGRLTTTRCRTCGRLGFPPRNLCRDCWGRDLEWATLSPRGTLYSFTRVHVVPGAFRADAPYAIGLVDLADGPRLMCRLVGEVGTGDLDGPVEMLVLRYEDGPLFGARVVRADRGPG